jgi:hypothetical protein
MSELGMLFRSGVEIPVPIPITKALSARASTCVPMATPRFLAAAYSPIAIEE